MCEGEATRIRKKLTPPDIAKAWGVSPDKVLAWIRNGELKAINVATKVGLSRPRYKIDPKDLAAFEERRTVRVVERTSRPTRRSFDEGITQFY